MSLAYDYQRAIDAAQTLGEIVTSLLEHDRDRKLQRVANRFRLASLKWRLEEAVDEILIPRRNQLNPESADETKATKGGAK